MMLNRAPKKLIFTALLVTTSVLNPAMAKETQAKVSSPFRIGFGLAAEYMSLSGGLKEELGGTLGAENYGNSSHATKTFNVAPVFEIGGFIKDKMYLGMVGSWHYSNMTHKSRSYLDRQYYFTHELEMTSYTTIFFKSGYKITKDVMAYGLIGPSYARWKHNSTQYQQNNVVDTFNKKKDSWGIAFGGGVEFDITNSSALSVDYTHTIYRRQKATKTISYQDRVGMLLVTRTGPMTKSVQPSHGVLSLKYTYFF